MRYCCPVDFVIEAKDDFHLQQQLNEFLRNCYREFAANFNVLDFDLPVGYPTIKECNGECVCTGCGDNHQQ